MKNKSFVDYLGNPLQVGDTVAFSLNIYCQIGVAKIHHFGDKQIVLDAIHKHGKLLPVSEKGKNDRRISRYPHDVIKMPREYLED